MKHIRHLPMNKSFFNTIIVLLVAIGMLQFSACKKDDEKEVVPAKFTVDSTTIDNNHPIFTSTSQPKDTNLTIYFSWSFGNGDYSTERVDSTTYDFPGTYIVTLGISTSEGAYDEDTIHYKVSKINIELKGNPYLANLALSREEEHKSWVLSNQAGHMAIGPSQGIENGTGLDFVNDSILFTTTYPEDYLVSNTLNEEAYSNVMTFDLEQYYYHNSGPTKSWVVNWAFANIEFGYNQPEGEDVCLDVASNSTQLDTLGRFTLEENDNGTVFLSFSGRNFMLYYEGKPSKTKYQVLALYSDLLVVRKPYYNAEGTTIGYRYLRYVPEGNTELPDRPLSIIDPPSPIEIK